MKKITVDGYKGFVSTLRVEEGANGCPYLLGDQDWDYKVRADIYIGSNRELTKLWQIFRVCRYRSLIICKYRAVPYPGSAACKEVLLQRFVPADLIEKAAVDIV